MPQHTDVRADSANLTDLKPAEYRADLVLLLVHEEKPVLGIIVEVQLSTNEDKKYAWPAYIANLRARIRCPVCLLVVTVDESVARWAAKPIDLGVGNFITPVVLRPSNAPAITDLDEAEANVEMAVLSAVAHAEDSDVERAVRIASAAIKASAALDLDRGKLYWDLIFKSLSEDAQQALQEMKPANYEYMSDFARRYVAEGRDQGKVEGWLEGKAEGRAEGKAEGKVEACIEIVLRLITLRFGPVPEAIRVRVRDACSARGEQLIDGILMAKTLEEALDVM